MPAEKRTPPRPSPAEFDDYREYLRAVVQHLKEYKRGFSYRSFAKRAGYSSPSSLPDVIEGRAQLSPSAVEKFSRGLGLNRQETELLEALVLLGRAKTDEERNRHYERLRRKAGPLKERTQIEGAQYDVYTHWYALPIREMFALPDFKEDPEWIASRIFPPIEPAQARRALELLEEVGLAKRDGSGKLIAAEMKFTTPPTLTSLAVRNYHRAMLERAIGTLDGIPARERNITSLSFPLRKAHYKEICQRIWGFEQEIADYAEFSAKNAEGESDIYMMSVQLFPLTRKAKGS